MRCGLQTFPNEPKVVKRRPDPINQPSRIQEWALGSCIKTNFKDADEFKGEHICSKSGTAKGYSMPVRWDKAPRLDSRRSKFEDYAFCNLEILRSKVRHLSDLD